MSYSTHQFWIRVGYLLFAEVQAMAVVYNLQHGWFYWVAIMVTIWAFTVVDYADSKRRSHRLPVK